MGVQLREDKTWTVKLTLSPSAVSANTTAEQTFPLPGLLLLRDVILGVSKPTAQAGLGIAGFRVTANGTLGVTFSNATGSGITPTAGEVYYVTVRRPEQFVTTIQG